MSSSKKLPTEGGRRLEHTPFATLEGSLRSGGLALPPPVVPGSTPPPAVGAPLVSLPATKNRGRVDILRSTAGRGGKTVTVVQGFVGIGAPEKEDLAKKMQRRGGCGGTVKDGRIEIQGDQRDVVAEVLREAGFRPVLAGG